MYFDKIEFHKINPRKTNNFIYVPTAIALVLKEVD
jgi:hypothetical protein